jgi:hypothetical protein
MAWIVRDNTPGNLLPLTLVGFMVRLRQLLQAILQPPSFSDPPLDGVWCIAVLVQPLNQPPAVAGVANG